MEEKGKQVKEKENAVDEKDLDQPPKKKRKKKKDANKENHSKVKKKLVSLICTLLVESLRKLFNNFQQVTSKNCPHVLQRFQ